MTPVTPPEYMFQYVETVREEECFFCPDPILPIQDSPHIVVTIPTKTLFKSHYACFHQLGWSMTYFVIHYGPEEVVLN